MYKQIIENIKPELENTIEYLKNELNKIRVGRATPVMVEDLKIECYGQTMPLKQLANISSPQSRTLIIQPWDKSIIEDIEKGIFKSPLGLTPIVDKEVIRINIPALSEERRKEIQKILGEKIEEAKISIRHKREEAWKETQEQERRKEITEDEKFKAKDDLQDLVKEYNQKIEELKKRKEQEINTI